MDSWLQVAKEIFYEKLGINSNVESHPDDASRSKQFVVPVQAQLVTRWVNNDDPELGMIDHHGRHHLGRQRLQSLLRTVDERPRKTLTCSKSQWNYYNMCQYLESPLNKPLSNPNSRTAIDHVFTGLSRHTLDLFSCKKKCKPFSLCLLQPGCYIELKIKTRIFGGLNL